MLSNAPANECRKSSQRSSGVGVGRGEGVDEGLVGLVPEPDPEAKRDPFSLSGEIPSPIDIPAGCRLRTRCPLAQPICAEPVPYREVASGHFAACHLL